MTDLPLLYSDDTERSFLGAMLINPGGVQDIDLRDDDFYGDRNRKIWHTMKSLSTRGIEPDFVSLCASLEKQDALIDIGGGAYLAELVNSPGTFMNSSQYAASIRDYGRRRRALLAASKLAAGAYNLISDFDASTQEVVQEIVMDVSSRRGAEPISGAIDALYAEVEELSKNPRGEVWGMPTKILDYDRISGGLHKGEVVYIAGEPGVGKSILAMQMAINLAMQGYPGAIYSLEMGSMQLCRRMVSAVAKVDNHKLKTGRLSDVEMTAFVQGCQAVALPNLFLCSESDITISDLRADIARLKNRHGLAWFVLDYLYLLNDDGGVKRNETELTAVLSRKIKTICRSYDVAGITVNSVVKDGMDGGVSGKKAMRGSGQVIHDADVIMFLRDPASGATVVNDPHIKVVTIEKGREIEGTKQMFSLWKHDSIPLFENVTRTKL